MDMAMDQRKDAVKDYSYLKRTDHGADPVFDTKVPWIELAVLLGVAQSPALYYFLQFLWVALPKVGYALPNCSETGNFLMNNLYGIETFNAFATVPLALALAILGLFRVVKKRRWGVHFMAAGLVFMALNAYLTYECVHWYTSTSNATTVANATAALKQYGQAQKEYFAKNGVYADSIDKLGGAFAFPGDGAVNIVKAGPDGVVAQANHICLPHKYYWDTKSGVVVK